MKKLISFLFILTVSSFIVAQQKGAHISFDNATHDFGTFKEEGGSVKYKFEFTNTGSAPLVITNVKASCGCTSSNWTKQPVSPGNKGFVIATFNPQNRPGKFNKSITVNSNALNPVTVLHIKGNVIPKVKTVEDYYPKVMGKIRLESTHFSFTKVLKGKVKSSTLKIINTSEEPVRITFPNLPHHIQLKTEPEVLGPNQKGLITGNYDSDKKNDWGFIYDRIKIAINEVSDPGYNLTISATIQEDFSHLTPEEIENAQRIEFKAKTFDFGTIKQHTSVEHEFSFKNVGKKDLIIRKVKASCGCTSIAPAEKIIRPGQTSSIKAKFSAGSRRGRQNKTISVITNDPKNSNTTLRLSGSVESPE